MPGDCSRLLVEVELARGDVDAADRAAERLADYADESDSPVLRAEAKLADGRVAMRSRRTAAAIAALEAGLDALGGEERPILAAMIRLELAHALADVGDTASARDDRRSAVAALGRLRAARTARAASSIERLGA